jgi:hypothetical protein
VNIRAMSVPELSRAATDLAALAQEIADEHPEAAKAIIDLGALIGEELLARAFGGDGEARAHARKVYRERAGH